LLAALSFSVEPARAALDPEPKQPYALTVVLSVAPHPLLTPVFREQLQRELRDSLQAAFGKLAQVKIVTEHPLLAEVSRRGLREALDGCKDGGVGKTHFVIVDYADGRYDLQTAQYDGRTGIPSPIVRRAVLEDPADRPLVARTAALQVEADFGVVGTVADAGNPAKVRVELQGHALGEPLDRWVRKDDVFAIAQTTRSGSQRVPEAYLQVIDGPRDGVCFCRLLARYADGASRLVEAPGVLGYRCLKLGTNEGPLRLRVIDDQGAPQTGVQVMISALGFDPRRDDFKPAGTPDRDGLVKTDRTFAQIAFVRMMSNGVAVAQIPAPILAGHTIVCRVNIEPGNELTGQVTQHRQRYLDRLTEALQVQANLRVTLNELMAKGQPERALERGRAGLSEQTDEWKNLKEELAGLKKELADPGLTTAARSRLRLEAAEQRLRQVETGCQGVKEYLDKVDALIKDKPKQKAAEALVLRARELQHQEAKYDEALRVYQEARDQATEGLKGVIEREMAKLQADWELREPKEPHRKARAVLYEALPQADSFDRLRDALERAPAALEVCKKCGDRLTLRKLLAPGTLPALLGVINREQNGVRGDTEDGRQRLKTVGEATEQLTKLVNEVTEYLKPAQPTK
jgi:hypothetical protein